MFVIRLSEASVFRSILRGPDDFESTRFSCTLKIYCTNYIVYSMSIDLAAVTKLQQLLTLVMRFDLAAVTKFQQLLTLVMSFDLATVTKLQLGLKEH